MRNTITNREISKKDGEKEEVHPCKIGSKSLDY